MHKFYSYLKDNFNFSFSKLRRYLTASLTVLLSIVTISTSLKNIFNIDVLDTINDSLVKKRFAEAYGSGAAPVAVDDTFTVYKNSTDNTLNITANDSDAENDPIFINSFDQPASGNLFQNSNDFIYTPSTGFVGQDTFQYRISDLNSVSAFATVTISVVEPCGTGSSGGGPVNDVLTNICLNVTAGVLSLYAGDSNPDNDVCTPTNITAGDVVDTTISGQGATSVTCDTSENSISLTPLNVSSVRQNTTSTIYDIVFEDLRGLATSDYTVTATISDFTVQNTSKAITLGSNPDSTLDDTEQDAPQVTEDIGKIFAVLNPSIATITPLRSAQTIANGITDYQKGSSTTVIDTTTPITLLSTTTPVTPGRIKLDEVGFKLRVPSLLEAGDYKGVIIQTII